MFRVTFYLKKFGRQVTLNENYGSYWHVWRILDISCAAGDQNLLRACGNCEVKIPVVNMHFEQFISRGSHPKSM